MKKSPDERYATPMQVAQALEPYGDDQAGVVNREDEPPLLEPLGVEPAPPINDVAHRHEAGRAALAAREFRLGVAAVPNSMPSAADPAGPLLTPDDDPDETAGEVRLILDHDPERSWSKGQSRHEQQSSSDDSASESVAAKPLGAAGSIPALVHESCSQCCCPSWS